MKKILLLIVFIYGVSFSQDCCNVFDRYGNIVYNKEGVCVKAPKLPAPDTDGDGVCDSNDECPTVAGVKDFGGCPDTDGDGIADKNDSCPTVAGLKEFAGCPDTDGDGITDKEDSCPTIAGLKAFAGCPDTDGDGITDKEDSCPTVAGLKEFAGCPDTDGDKVSDNVDSCPTVAGPIENKGCPVVTAEVQKTLNKYAKTILFDTGKATIKKESFVVLDEIVKILNEYASANFAIEGHTDNVGKAAANLKLSDDRAAAVMAYLVQKGISTNRLTSKGYGMTKPIASNKTKKGKANNRRVEINLVN